MVGTFSFTKTGLVPDEDTGTLFCTITMPPATSEARTKEIVAQVDSILAADPAIQSREQIQGYNRRGYRYTLLYHHYASCYL